VHFQGLPHYLLCFGSPILSSVSHFHFLFPTPIHLPSFFPLYNQFITLLLDFIT
jgi:hypothetical protein